MGNPVKAQIEYSKQRKSFFELRLMISYQNMSEMEQKMFDDRLKTLLEATVGIAVRQCRISNDVNSPTVLNDLRNDIDNLFK
jgi:hypothetical protein